MPTATTMPTTTDRIEKSIQLASPTSRVWRALTTAREFGTWFRVKLDGEFVAGQPINGNITVPNYEHVMFDAIVNEIRPETHFSFWWRPYAIDASVDYSHEPRTLVAFTLEAVDGGTLLTVVESGFDGIPVARRELAFQMNDRGWAGQLKQIEKYLLAEG